MQNTDEMDYENMYIYPEDIAQEFDIGDKPLDVSDNETDHAVEQGTSMMLDEPDIIFSEHTGHVYALAAHPTDQNLIVSGGGDDIGIVWDASTGKALHRLKGHTDSVVAVAFNFNGTLVATGGYDGVVRVWSAATGEMIKALEGPSEEVEWFQWHQKGNVILAGSTDGTAWLWLATSGECMQVFAGHEEGVSCGSFSGSGKIAVTGSNDATLRMWNPKTGECMHVFRGHDFHEGPICTVICHPHQPLCITGSQDGTARLVHLQTKKVLLIMSHKPNRDGSEQMEHIVNSVECAAFSTTTNWCATGCLGGELRIWDLSNNTCRHVCRHEEGITKLAWHPTEPWVVTVCVDGTARCWDARNGECMKTFMCHAEMIVDMLLVNSGYGTPTTLYTASEDLSIRRFTL